MIASPFVALWQRYIRFLITHKERVGMAERCVRALLLIPPYCAVALPLLIRAAVWKPVTVFGTTEDGIRLRCRLPDIIQMYVYLFGTWEPDLTAFMRRSLRPGDTFIDVGANVGYNSALASRLVGPSGVVVAIEPAPLASAALQETISINALTNIRLVESAASDREDELRLFVGPSFGMGLTTTVSNRFLLREHGRVRAAPLGSLVTLDELATTRLIKIDVEGAEDRVLDGTVASIDALTADAELVIEVLPKSWSNPQLRPIDVLRPFLDRGFHVYLMPSSYWPWRCLWPKDVGAPRRLRDLAVLEERGRLDVVLSRRDVDAL